jgi:hypothetical protein
VTHPSEGEARIEAGSGGLTALQLKRALANNQDVSRGDDLIGSRQPHPDAVGRTVHDKVAEWISVKDFGAVGDGTNGEENREAFQTAISAASSMGVSLHVPAGTYVIAEPAGSYTPQIGYADKIRLFGDGVDQSIIRFDPDAQQVTGFTVVQGGQLILEDLTLEGRSSSDELFMHVYAFQGEGTVIKARRCRFTEHSIAFKPAGGTYFLEFSDCEFDVKGADPNPGSTVDDGFAVLASENEGSGGVVHFEGCSFRSESHCMYIGTGVSLLVDRCTFEASGKYSIRVKQDTPGVVPEYVRIRGSVFKSLAGRVQTSSVLRSFISDCTFIGKPDEPRIQPEAGGVQLTGCHFTGKGGRQIDDFATATGEVMAVNCRFEGLAEEANIFRSRESTALWRFVGYEFLNEYVGSDQSYCIWSTDRGDFEFVGCTFEKSPHGANNGHHFLRMAGGKLILRGCLVAGEGSLYITAESENHDVDSALWDNTFASQGPGSGLWIQPTGSGEVTVRGSGNRFQGLDLGPHVDDPEGRVRGWLMPPQERGADIESARTIVVSPSHSFYHVLGEETVAKIALKGAGTPERIFHGPIRLVAGHDPGFSLAEAADGNVRPRSTDPRAQHEVVMLMYDSSEGWWYEV